MQSEETQSVYKTYDKIAKWFSENRNSELIEKNYLDDLISRLASNASILDLGCGTGMPILKYLTDQKQHVVGVDASMEMLKIAQSNFPSVEFILEDMRILDLDTKFDAIIAWHSFFHLPASDQPAMFQRFAKYLNPNGILIFTSGTTLGEAWGMNGGEHLFHASLDTIEYESLLEKHHFEILKHQISDPDCGYATIWMAKYVPYKL